MRCVIIFNPATAAHKNNKSWVTDADFPLICFMKGEFCNDIG